MLTISDAIAEAEASLSERVTVRREDLQRVLDLLPNERVSDEAMGSIGRLRDALGSGKERS